MALRRLIGPLAVVALILLSSPSRAVGSLESQVFAKINGERSTPLIEHSGLVGAARQHSQEMAAAGGLNHDGADERVANAAPDPPEANGPPDDGFAPAAWCENVTYSTGFPESQVAQKIYEQWHGSGAHDACMSNPDKNVGAVGIYFDGSTWWATFIAEVDHTPPGSAASPPPSRPSAADGARTAGTTAGPAATPSSASPAATAPPEATIHAAAAPPASTDGEPAAPVPGVGATSVGAPPAADGTSPPRYEIFVQPLTDDVVAVDHARHLPVDAGDGAQSTAVIAAGLVVLRRLDGRRRALLV